MFSFSLFSVALRTTCPFTPIYRLPSVQYGTVSKKYIGDEIYIVDGTKLINIDDISLCPHCGCDAEVMKHPLSGYVCNCRNCGGDGNGSTISESIKTWNRYSAEAS